MEILWCSGDITAKELSGIVASHIGWNKNTTYTVIKKLVDKNCIGRSEPGFMCRALITREETQMAETNGLLECFYGKSKKAPFSALLDDGISDSELEELRRMVDDKYKK